MNKPKYERPTILDLSGQITPQPVFKSADNFVSIDGDNDTAGACMMGGLVGGMSCMMGGILGGGVPMQSYEFTGKLRVPFPDNVRDGEEYDSPDTPQTGVLDVPAETDVRDEVAYDNGTKEGNLELPPEQSVLLDYQYGASGAEFTGELALVSLDVSLSAAEGEGISLSVGDPEEINLEVE